MSSIRFSIFAAFATSCGDAVAPWGLNGFILDNELDMFELEDDWGVVNLISDGVLLRDLLLIGD